MNNKKLLGSLSIEIEFNEFPIRYKEAGIETYAEICFLIYQKSKFRFGHGIENAKTRTAQDRNAYDSELLSQKSTKFPACDIPQDMDHIIWLPVQLCTA